MPKFKRKSGTFSRIDELAQEHFTYRQTCYHGFPSLVCAMNFDEETQLLALGTRTGEFRVYGRPGVEFRAQVENEVSIKKIYSFGNLYQYITLQEDNSLLLWHLDSEDGPPHLRVAKEFKMESDSDKIITACCLSRFTGLFYVGTESGHVYSLDVRLFELREGDVINWDKATSLIQGASPNLNPGAVCCLELCPSKHSKLLIGYKKGIISLWDLDKSFPERNYPPTVQDCQQPLESLCWQNEGRKFVTAHSDSGIYFWDSKSSVPQEGPTRHYGENCDLISKISWLNTDSNPLIVFNGGLPQADVDEHHTVTIIQGTEHIVLDFTSPVVDYATVTDPSTKRGKTLIVLCEQEIMAFDLEAPKCPKICKPYLYSIHASPVTCVRVYESCPRELLAALKELGTEGAAEPEVAMWPVSGGYVRSSVPASIDILITGHEDGSIKLWDISTPSMYLLHQINTSLLFSLSDETFADDKIFSDFTWPPYRKVSSYDPFEDDERLAIKFVELCPHSSKVCAGGMSGQVLTFALNPFPADVKVKSVTAEIYIEETTRSRRGQGLRNTSSLECKSEFISLPAGFQPSFCVQCLPAQPITSLAFRPSFGLVAAGNSKGFMVGNFYTKTIIIVHPTVLSDGVEIRNISKVQSMRRSLRGSLRRRSISSITDDERRKMVHALNLEIGLNTQGEGGNRKLSSKRAMSTDTGLALDGATPLPISPPTVPPDQMGNVSHLVFAETHVAAGGPHVGIFASTLGSSVIRYTIEVPKNEEKFTVPSRAFPAGKDYALVHAAPIVAVFVLDHDGHPIPSPVEVEHHIVPVPNAAPPHFAVIVTQEQIKVVSLPSMRSKRKEKVYNLIHERILKAWTVRVKVPVAPVGAPRDWNNGLAILTSIGHLLVYSMPDLRLTYRKEHYINPSDQKAMHSITISQNGEVFFLRSFSEIERRILCSYNLSDHTLLMPSLHSTSNDLKSTSVRKTVATPKREEKPPPQELPTVLSPGHSYSVRNRSKSPSATPSHEGAVGETREAKKTVVVNGSTSPTGLSSNQTEFTDSDRKVLDSAKAFTDAYFAKKKANAVASSSSESESDSDSDSDSDDDGENAGTFGNPLAFDDNSTGEGKELDNIIASSLQQLENARAFYERMQQQHGRKPSNN